MKVALASDERNWLTDFLVRDLERRGQEGLRFGAVAEVDTEVTGRQASVMQPKRSRAAILRRPSYPAGPDRSVDCRQQSLRSTSEAVAKEILDAWYGTLYSDDEWNRKQIERIANADLARPRN